MGTGKKAAKRGPGRPKVADARKVRGFRMSDEEWELVGLAAEKDNRQIAQWIRDRLLTAAHKEVA